MVYSKTGNALVTGPGSVTPPPSDDDSLDPSTLPSNYVNDNLAANATPEGPTAIYLLLGIFCGWGFHLPSPASHGIARCVK